MSQRATFSSHLTPFFFFFLYFLFQIRFGHLKILPKLIPALKTLFAEVIGEMEERREKRHLRGSSKMTAAPQGAKRDQEEEKEDEMEASCSVETKRRKTS